MTVVSRMDDDDDFRGYDLYVGGGKLFVHLVNSWPKNALRVNTRQPIIKEKWHHVCATYDGSSQAAGIQIYVDGRQQDLEATHDTLKGSIDTNEPFRIGQRRDSAAMVGMLDEIRLYHRVVDRDEIETLAKSDPIERILSVPAGQRSTALETTLLDFFLERESAEFRALREAKQRVDDQRRRLEGEFASTLVMQEMSRPRQAFCPETR